MFQFLFLFALVIIGTWFGAVKLMENMRIEYEYILTNGDLDVDIIINKSRRKRITTIKCAEIESIKRYDFSNKGAQDIVCCDESQEAYLIIARDTNRRVMRLVMAPNEKIKSGIVKYLPRILVKDAFI